jgi:folate-binding protein YgfZ
MRADYGDVTAEYLALRSGRGLVSGFSEIVWATGPDTVEFLDGQASQDIAAMPVGSTARSLILEPRGKLVAIPWLLRGSDRVGLVVARGRGTAVIEHLERFKFRVDVDLHVDGRETMEVWGGHVDDALKGLDLPANLGWVDGEVTAALLVGNPLSRLVLAGLDTEAAQRLDLAEAGRIAVDSVRVEAGEPVMGVDLDGGTIPQESGLVSAAVSFTKGCYVGQELVARIDSRGRVNRRLVGITMEENIVPPVGAEVAVEDATVGTLSTVGESLAVRAPVALAMVRREVEPGDGVTVRWNSGEIVGRVRSLPLDDLSTLSHSSYTEDRE